MRRHAAAVWAWLTAPATILDVLATPVPHPLTELDRLEAMRRHPVSRPK